MIIALGIVNFIGLIILWLALRGLAHRTEKTLARMTIYQDHKFRSYEDMFETTQKIFEVMHGARDS